MNFSIAIPQDWQNPQALQGFLFRAETLGFQGAWTQEQIMGRSPMLGPLELLSFAAANTTTLRLGCAVLLAPHYAPLHLAKSLATLDVLSQGRLDVGLASGGPNRQLEAFGITREGLITRFNETIELMKACWTQPRIDHHGRFYQLRDGAMEPKPVQRPHPPLWYGGSARPAVERAARHADGFIGAGSTTTKKFRECVTILKDHERKIPIAKRVYVTLDDNLERARKSMDEELHRLYSMFRLPNLLEVAVYGPPEAVAEGLQEVVDAGAEMILLNPLTNELEQIERLTQEVLPRVGRKPAPRE